MSPRIKLILTVFVVLSLSACTVKVSYNLLDWIISWKLGQYVDFDKVQSKRVNTLIDNFHTWHRETQLPQYATFIESFTARLAASKPENKPFTTQEIHTLTDEAQVFIDQSIEYIIPKTLETISGLSDKQVEQILKRIRKDQDKYLKEDVNISPEKAVNRREKELLKNLKKWMAKPNKTQRAWIREWAEKLKPYEQLMANQQQVWTDTFRSYLQARQNNELLEKGLRTLMFYRTDDWGYETEKVMDYNQALTLELLAKLLNSLDEKQVEKTIKKLKRFEKDFLTLSRSNLEK